MKKKKITLTLEVTVPEEVKSDHVEYRINEALDEPPCDWGDWFVSAASVEKFEIIEEEEG